MQEHEISKIVGAYVGAIGTDNYVLVNAAVALYPSLDDSADKAAYKAIEDAVDVAICGYVTEYFEPIMGARLYEGCNLTGALVLNYYRLHKDEIDARNNG